MARVLKAPKEQAPKPPASVVPEFARVDHGHGFPRIPITPPFLLVFSPTRWMVMADRLVPQLSKQPLQRGINRIDQDAAERWRLGDYRARLEEEGRTIVSFDWAPDGQSYIQAVDSRPDGTDTAMPAHISVWESAYPGDSETHPDVEAYSEWLAGLVTSKRLPACPIQVVRRKLEKARERSEEASAAVATRKTGSASIRAKQLAAEVTTLERVLEERKGANKPATGKSVTIPE